MKSMDEESKNKLSGYENNRGYGQRPETKLKYQKAIEDCRSLNYINDTLSEIARRHHLHPTGLTNQLKGHFPEILEWRNAERIKRGIFKFNTKGASQITKQQYSKALYKLQHSEDTIQEVADELNLSYGGLKQYVLFYHKGTARTRLKKRIENMQQKYPGKRSGNNSIHKPRIQTVQKYAEALDLFIRTSLTYNEIAIKTGVSAGGFYNYIRLWHRDLIVQRRNLGIADPYDINFNDYKRFLKSTRIKYLPAIGRLKTSNLSSSEVAKEFHINPESFRAYLKMHEPSLYERNGMKQTQTGKRMLSRSYYKYKGAIEYYQSNNVSLLSVANKFELSYVSLSNFIHRHYPGILKKYK